jgi:hypothetical protein
MDQKRINELIEKASDLIGTPERNCYLSSALMLPLIVLPV